MATLTIDSTIRKFPRHPYQAMKDKVVGKQYELSLVFVGKDRARNLNISYRQKDYIPNVLSFPLSESAGEIYICPAVAVTEAKKFNLTPNNYIAYLFIHGLLHLKGYDHGDTMEQQERKYLRAFGLVKKHNG